MNADKRPPSKDDQYVELAVEVFRMLSDATRVKLLVALNDGERSVADLAEAVGKTPPATSQHLAKLRLARLVTTRQEGTRVFYRMENDHVGRMVVDALYQAEHSAGGLPPHHRDLRALPGSDRATGETA